MAIQAGSNSKALTSVVIKAAAVDSSIICKAGHLIGLGGNQVRIHAADHTRHLHHLKHALHMRHVDKIIMTAKLSIAVGGKIMFAVGVALGGIGVLVDIVTGIMALYDILGKTKCSESRALTHNIEKAKRLAREVQAYYDLLLKEPHEYFDKDIAGIDELRIEELKEENEQLRIEIGEMKQKHETVITELEQKNENLRVEMKEQQSQFLQAFKEEQEKQQREMKKVQELLQQQLHQIINLQK